MATNLDAFDALRKFMSDKRHELRLTQDEAAAKGGIPPGSWANIESGTRPSIPRQETIAAIAKALDSPYWLVDRIARGVPVDKAIGESDLAMILSEEDPTLKAMLVEIALAPASQKPALKAALAAALAMTRPL